MGHPTQRDHLDTEGQNWAVSCYRAFSRRSRLSFLSYPAPLRYLSHNYMHGTSRPYLSCRWQLKQRNNMNRKLHLQHQFLANFAEDFKIFGGCFLCQLTANIWTIITYFEVLCYALCAKQGAKHSFLPAYLARDHAYDH